MPTRRPAVITYHFLQCGRPFGSMCSTTEVKYQLCRATKPTSAVLTSVIPSCHASTAPDNRSCGSTPCVATRLRGGRGRGRGSRVCEGRIIIGRRYGIHGMWCPSAEVGGGDGTRGGSESGRQPNARIGRGDLLDDGRRVHRDRRRIGRIDSNVDSYARSGGTVSPCGASDFRIAFRGFGLPQRRPRDTAKGEVIELRERRIFHPVVCVG